MKLSVRNCSLLPLSLQSFTGLPKGNNPVLSIKSSEFYFFQTKNIYFQEMEIISDDVFVELSWQVLKTLSISYITLLVSSSVLDSFSLIV